MRFTSTRDASKFYTFEDALLLGYAPDGGLFVPEDLPSVDTTTLHESWSKLSYVDLSTQVLLPFVEDEIPQKDLHQLLQGAFSGFDTMSAPNIVPVIPLEPHRVYVAELFHGPTFCFKDLGMRVTIYLLNYFATKRNSTVTLVVSTTGDTGPAAVRAVTDLDSPHLGILVHYPEGQISDFQRKQLTTADSTRVTIAAFQGGGDDMDIPIKRIITSSSCNEGTGSGDEDDSTTTTTTSKKRYVVCGVNSYNIGRPLMQMVHFIWTYLRIVEDMGGLVNDEFTLDVVIPTGAMGNIAGCYMAQRMGVPLGTLNAGVNINDITDVAFTTGLVERTSESMKTTLSEAINIQLPYNLERLLFYLTKGCHEQVAAWYRSLEYGDDHRMDLRTNDWLTQLQKEFVSARVTDDELCTTMQHVLREYGYWTDPNTGVAFCAAQKLGYIGNNDGKNKDRVVAIMATAAPCKFQEAVTTALGRERWDEYERKYFPAVGKALRERKETPPYLYEAEAGKSLSENQVLWEAKARELIMQLAVAV